MPKDAERTLGLGASMKTILPLTALLLATPVTAQRTELSFAMVDLQKRGESKAMTRADFPAEFLLIIYQGIP